MFNFKSLFFIEESSGELKQSIINDEVIFPETLPILNDQLKDLILKMLAKNPKDRIKITEI